MNAPPAFDARRDGAALAIVAGVALALQLLVYDRWISLLDEGAIAQIADQINHGLLPYREAVHLAFPGVFYLAALLQRVFEPSFLVGRCLMVGAFTAFVVLVYLLARTISGRGVALGAALLAVAYRMWVFPHWQMLSYAPLAILCLSAGVAILALDAGRPRRYLPPLAGLAIGIGILFKQDSTSITLAVLSLFELLSARQASSGWLAALRRTAGFVAAACLPPIAVMLAFAPAGLTGELLYQTVWVPLVAKPLWAAASTAGPYTAFPPLWPPWEPAPEIRSSGYFIYFPSLLLDLYWREMASSRLFRHTLLPELFVRIAYALPYALLAFFAGREIAVLRSRRGAEGTPPHVRRLRLLLCFGVALMASFNRPRDWVHLMVLYAPTLILLAGFAEVLAGGAPGLRRRLVLGAGALGVAAALASSFGLAFAVRGAYTHPLPSARAGVLVKEDVAAALVPLLEALRPSSAADPAPLAALPASPTLNFLTGRPLATRFLTLLPLEEFPDRDDQILADFARDPRTEFVYSLQRAAIFRRPQDYAPGVFAALVDDYELGVGAGRVFSGTRPEGLLLVRLARRPPRDENVLHDCAERLDEATIAATGAPPDAVDAAAEPFASLDVWPFESPVVSVTPPAPPGRRELSYSVDLPVRSRLRFAAAMNPDEWASLFPCGLRFVVEIDGSAVFDAVHDPRRDFDDRRWLQADLPVAPGAHTITFATGADNEFCAAPRIAGWARPRLVAASEE